MRTWRSSLRPASAAALLLTVAVQAQPASPPKRAHHALVYDPSGKRVLLTGGSTPTDGGRSSMFFNDLWAFDGSRWTALPPSGTTMSGMQLAFDTKRGRLLSFGGFDGSSLGDLRVLEKNAWRTLGRHAEMPAAEPGFVYDSRRDRFVAFGGSPSSRQTHGDTWEYDGAQWTKAAVPGPPARQAHVMVFDSRRGVAVVFGGMGAATSGQARPTLADTWEFDGRRWSERKVEGPTARFGAGATYDSRRGRVILFGGLTPTGFQGDTWSWDGTAWKKLATTGPEPRGMGYLAYDQARDRVVLFGGRKGYPDGDLDDTWEWNGTAWRRFGR